jgi:hypothetical protein
MKYRGWRRIYAIWIILAAIAVIPSYVRAKEA